MVATAAYTGVREGELRGLLWENYDGKQIRVTQSVWRSQIHPPKTTKSSAPVPVLAQLCERLNSHRTAVGAPACGLIFVNPSTSKPLNLDALARDVIRPAFRSAGIEWHGWHAFRRGLATNLHNFGVADKTIQAILRHSNVAVTQSCYIKSVDGEAAAAMRSLQYATNMQPQNSAPSSEAS